MVYLYTLPYWPTPPVMITEEESGSGMAQADLKFYSDTSTGRQVYRPPSIQNQVKPRLHAAVLPHYLRGVPAGPATHQHQPRLRGPGHVVIPGQGGTRAWVHVPGDTWPYLSSSSVAAGCHWPVSVSRARQEERARSPPQRRPPSWLCTSRWSGSSGSRHEAEVEGRNSSTDW